MSSFEKSLEEIPWVPIVVGQKDPNLFDNKEWTTQPGDPFPIDIVLGLKYLTNVYKIVVDVHPDFVPSKIEISVGKGESGCGNDYEHAKAADYGVKGVLEYRVRERGNSRMEGRSLFSDHVGHFIWLVVHKPILSTKNVQKLVGINRVTILGYPVEKEKPRRAPSRTKSRGMRYEKATSTPLPPSVSPAASNDSEQPEYIVSRYSYVQPVTATTEQSEGDGMASGNGGTLGDDSLTTIRTVQRAIKEKMKTADEEGRDVEATVCLRALQRLDEYEVRLEDLDGRRRKALAYGDTVMADRFAMSMADCRDTVFRAIHVDLLLKRKELRSIGVSSSWKDGVQDY